MIRAGALRDRVTIFNRSTSVNVDRYGNPLDDEDAGTVVKAMVNPIGAGRGRNEEFEIDRDTRISRYVAIVEPGVSVTATSRVEWNGKSYEIVGEPQLFSGRGDHHLEFDMRLIT